MSRDGLARFCTMPYEPPTSRNIHSAFMHLTNYSLNKKSRNYLHTESEVNAKGAAVCRCKQRGWRVACRRSQAVRISAILPHAAFCVHVIY
jgi:Tubulin-tyrosine ligase family